MVSHHHLPLTLLPLPLLFGKMRRPYVEPGHRSARPGIRHRTRSNGPDRKGRDPSTLAAPPLDSRRSLPKRLASDSDSAASLDDDAEDFYTDEDHGLTDENAITANEDIDDDDTDEFDDRDDDESLRPLPRNTARQLPIEDDAETRTPRNRSRTSLGATTPRNSNRPRTYSRSSKLAPEEEEWALKQEQSREKGGVLGRLKLFGRKSKSGGPPTSKVDEGYNADAILGRSFGAERELRTRRSTTIKRNDGSSRNSSGRRIPFRSIGGAKAASTDSAYKDSIRSSVPSSGFDDDFDSELARAPRQSRLRSKGAAPSTIASDDGTDLAAPLVYGSERAVTPLPTSDLPPRLAMPVALRDAETARSPQLIDPYDVEVSEDDVALPASHTRSKSLAASVQPSVLEASDAASVVQPGSPLIPASGPLSHVDAVVPSQRPSMQSVRDAEIDQQNLSTSRKPSIDLRAAAGGALGGLAAMIGFDALNESKAGLPLQVPSATSEPTVHKSIDDVPLVDAAAVEQPAPSTEANVLPRKSKKKKNKAVEPAASVASVANGSAVAPAPSELPYTAPEPVPSSRQSLRSDADLATGADARKQTKQKKSRSGAAAAAAAVGAGLGGMGTAALLSNGSRRPDSVRNSVVSERSRIQLVDVQDFDDARLRSDVPASRSRSTARRVDAAPSSVNPPISTRDYATESVAPSTLYGDEDDRVQSRSSAALGAAALTKSTRKPKIAKGGRNVQKMPPLDEDHSVTYRQTAVQRNFLLTPSVAPSVADPIDAGRNHLGYKKGEWLTKDLSPQQTHYFLQDLSERELKWELDRAWLLTSFEKPVRQTRKARKDFSDVEDDSRINDFDESSDEDLLDMDEDEDEEAVFRRVPPQFGQMYTQTTIPDLPLLRFLFKNAFCTFPLFVAPEGKLDAYIGGPPDKATLARTYFFNGILPLLRALQGRSLSASVDRHGEGDGTPFSACSTTGALRRLLVHQAATYITAILRVGPADPYLDSKESLEKDAWSWPPANLLPSEAFFAYRKPLDKLKHGGYDVDIVGIRKRSATEREFIIRLRRPHRADTFVVRNDNDFEEFYRNLSKDLSPFAFVKPLPITRGRPDEGESDIEDFTPEGSEANFNAAGLGSGVQLETRRPARAGDTRQMTGGGRDGRRRYSSAKQNGRPVLGRDDFADDDDEDAFEESDDEDYSNDEGYSDGTEQPRKGRRDEPEADGRRAAKTMSLKTLLPFPKNLGSIKRQDSRNGRTNGKRDSLRRTASDSRPRRGESMNRGPPQRNSRTIANGNAPPPYTNRRDSARRPLSTARPSPVDFDARRQKLRTWLRDTLSIREAGHAMETQNFLTIGAFPERGLQRSDYSDMDQRRRIDKKRRKEHERDAEEAGTDVHELRDVCDELWLDCVDGDGFLKMYDALRDTPTYGRLPLKYQKMVSWSNLQTARWLYGAFVSGDESRANLARAQDVYETVPWKKLAFAMKMPATQMLRTWQDQVLKRGFLQAILHVMLEDEPETLEEDLLELRGSIGSEIMFQKLRVFVDSPGDLKRLIRQHAENAQVPLVAAIVRGSEQPKLNKAEVQRVMDATDSYLTFMRTTPSITKKNANKEPGYLLITELQRALRLLSLQRDGAQVRGMLQDPVIADALTAVFEPLVEELRRLHKIKGMSNSLMDLQSFLGRMLDHLCGLRARVVDPMYAINSIAEMLDDAALSWYPFLHRASEATPTVFSFFAWFRHLAMTVGNGSEDLAEIWTNPPPAPATDPADELDNEDGISVDPRTIPDHEGALDAATMRDINSLAESGRRQRNRDMEVACRWAAGDTDEHHSIRVPGDGQGKTRRDPYLPREPRPARKTPGLDRFRVSFREAVSSALGR